VDKLLTGLNEDIYYAVGYEGDIAVLINGKFPITVSEVLQTALDTVQQWCKKTCLSINPHKTVVILFNRKRDTYKGPQGTNSSWQNNTAVHKSQIPWTNVGQGITMEGTTEQCYKQGLQSILDL
jgi:hypothetical protein